MTDENFSSLPWTHAIASIGARGIQTEREATDGEREALKFALDVISVDGFSAKYMLRPEGSGRFLMTGTFKAKLTQSCVVTLDPLPQNIEETFSVSFCPPGHEPQKADGEQPVLEAPDVEVIRGDTLEAGRVLYELLAGSLNPYPRKEEAEFSWDDPTASPEDEVAPHPFAALAKLKRET